MAADVDRGLCGTCRHARTIVSGKGSKFTMCGRAAEDPGYRKYPPLPVRSCPGYEPGADGDARSTPTP